MVELSTDSTSTVSRILGSAVLVVDDDSGTIQTISRLLRASGLRVHEATSGSQAIAIATANSLDLALIDQRLPDMPGLDVGRTLRQTGIEIPWILMSAFMDFDVALEAGRQGALRAVSSPFDVEEVVVTALAQRQRPTATGWPKVPVGGRVRQPGSTVGRAAWWILRACDSVDDPSTLDDWGSFVRVGYSQLRDALSRLGIPPHDARDFMRVFRALARVGGRVDHAEGELAVRDYRTHQDLIERTGLLTGARMSSMSLDEFLLSQKLIKSDHPLLSALRELVTNSLTPSS